MEDHAVRTLIGDRNLHFLARRLRSLLNVIHNIIMSQHLDSSDSERPSLTTTIPSTITPPRHLALALSQRVE